MIRSKVSIAGILLSGLAAFAVVAEPALAGTCVPVTVKGRGPDPGRSDYEGIRQAHATSCYPARQGQEQLDQLLKGAAWRVCMHHLGGCLPLTLKSPQSAGGDMMVTCRKLG